MGFDDCNKEHDWSSDEVFFLRSLTSNVAAAIEKRESEKRYRDLFHLSPQPMWVFEVDSLKFLDVNESAIAHYGYTREEFLSMTMLDIRPLVEAAHAGNVLSQLENGNQESERKIYKHKKKDGTLIQVDIKSNNIYFKGKSAKVVLANDVTERINYISAIENQNTILQEIAWIQSHVVRAPLARLMALVNLKDTIDQAGLSQEELFKLIMNSANELDTIIRDIVGRSEHIEFTIQA
ncbi:MAG: PAS domain S-box protein [Cyclobacteriaceae bacterium]